MAGIIGLLPNKFITPVEGNQISLDSSDLIQRRNSWNYWEQICWGRPAENRSIIAYLKFVIILKNLSKGI